MHHNKNEYSHHNFNKKTIFSNISWNVFFKMEHIAKISKPCTKNLMPSNYLRKPRNGVSQRRLPH